MDHRWTGDSDLEKRCERCGATGALREDGGWTAFIRGPKPFSLAERRVTSCDEEVVRRVLED